MKTILEGGYPCTTQKLFALVDKHSLRGNIKQNFLRRVYSITLSPSRIRLCVPDVCIASDECNRLQPIADESNHWATGGGAEGIS